MTTLEYPPFLDAATKGFAAALVVAAAIVLATHAAIRHGKLKAFGGWARIVRQISDPFLRPIERRLLRWGGNPQDASLWLLGLSAVVGLLVVSGIRWLFGLVAALAALGQASPTQRLVAVIDWALAILNLLILVRFIGGWLGVSPHVWLMRVARRLTEWLIAPIRRALPRFAMIDLSPAVAYLLILLVRAVVIRSLATL